jgi:hypothetical protein
MRPHRGAQILVFGILSLVVCQLFGIAAWMMGNTDLHEMSMGHMDSSGRDLTQAGRVCGMVASGILIFQVVIVVVILISMAIAHG